MSDKPQQRQAWRAGLALATALASSCATAPPPPLDRFEATLAAQPSATAALEQWCAANRLGDPPTVVADVLPTPAPPEPADLCVLLDVPAGTPLGYRHVRLSCGGTTLSLAHNWYVRGRLTPAMNDTLAHSRLPFGKVAADLHFRRERLAGARAGTAGLRGIGAIDGACPPDTVLAHRALLRLPDDHPLALVVECYTPANLGGDRSAARRGTH